MQTEKCIVKGMEKIVISDERREGMRWVSDPRRGRVTILERAKDRTRQRILASAEEQYHGQYGRITGRFRIQFCDRDALPIPFWRRIFPCSGGTKREKKHENACARTRSRYAVFGAVASTDGVWLRGLH